MLLEDVFMLWKCVNPEGDGSLTLYSIRYDVAFLDTSLSPYSKLLLTSPTQVLSLVEEEKAVLQAQLSQEGDAQACFIQSALCLLQVTEAMCIFSVLKNEPVDCAQSTKIHTCGLIFTPLTLSLLFRSGRKCF